MKKLTFLFLSILVGFASCSDSDGDSTSASGDKTFLNPKIIDTRHVHAMKDENNPLKNLDLQFDQIIVEYTTLEPDMKTPVRLTGAITLPPPVYAGRTLPQSLLLYHEYTTAKRGERTSQNEVDALSALVNQYTTTIGITANLYGWTTTEDCPQAYCCLDANNKATIDFWDAALLVLDSLGYDVRKLPIVNVGYSAGGLASMGIQKYVAENRPDLHFELTASGGAPLDIVLIYKKLIEKNTTGYPCGMPLIAVSYKETFGMEYSYSDIFKSPLCDNIDEWILSKKYTTAEINNYIGLDKTVDEIFTSSMCDLSSPIAKSVMELMRKNSLCGEGVEWQPATDTRYFIFHSEGDTYVNYAPSLEMAEYLKKHGCTKLKTDFEDWGDHDNNGFTIFLAKTLLEIQKVVSGIDFVSEQESPSMLIQTVNAMVNDR